MASGAAKTGNLYGGRYAAVLSVAGSTGQVAVTFPAGRFSAAPVVSATGVSSDGRDIAVSIVDGTLTATGVTLQARKSQTLPVTGLLTNLLGADPFTAAPAGTKIHVIAQAASA